jgi:hypothetical protein
MSKINPIDHPDSFETFKTWSEKFKQRNGGYFPPHLKGWYDAVEKNHEFIRKYIGGIRKEFHFNLKSQQNAVSTQDAAPFIDALLALVPTYLEAHVYTKDVFLKPTIPSGTHNVIKISKHFRSYAEALLRYDNDKVIKLKEIDKNLAKLGEVWAKSRTSNVDLEATISTSPRSFMLLGHYGPDQDSCFRQGSDKTRDKFVLAQSPNTFTISIAKKQDGKDKYNNVARCFGWTDLYFKTAHTANYYLTTGFPEGDGIEVLKRIFSSLWNDECEIHDVAQAQYIPENTVFHNPYGRWTFTKGKDSPVKSVDFRANLAFIKSFVCPRCRENLGGEGRNWAVVDDLFLCPHCTEGANICELTQELTFKDLVDFIDEAGNLLQVNPNAVVDRQSCDECGRKHSLTMHGANDAKLCNDCYDANFTECESCHAVVRDDELSDIGDIEICSMCLENGVIPFENDALSIVRG